MTIRVLLTAVGIVLLLANPGWAQSTTTPSSPTIPTGNFDSLSPGNQKIANALFSAQKTTGTTTPLTKNQIAGLRSTEGWGRVFKTMKADGLVTAKNLGQVVSSYNHSQRSSTTSTASRSTRTTTAASATTRSGRSTTHASARSGGRFSSAGMTSGRGFAGGSHAMGGRVATSAMGGGFGHGGTGGGGLGGGFSHGGGGGHGR
jgi:hypothetical protein